MIVFLTVEHALLIHTTQLELYCGQEGLRDPGSLASAVAMPQATFGGEYLHESLFHMAAAYAFHIAEAQAFLDGNKRTGVAASLTFLKMNDITIEDKESFLYTAMLDIAHHKLTKNGLAELFSWLADQTTHSQ